MQPFDVKISSYVDRLVEQFEFLEKGSQPKIVISDWKRDSRDNNNESKKELNPEDVNELDWQGIDPGDYIIEEYLGAYFSKEERIELYVDGIYGFAQTLNCRYSDLLSVIVIHELGHWLSHKAVINKNVWDTASYNTASEYKHELIAQLITSLLLQHVNKPLHVLFEKMASSQSQKYSTYTAKKYFEIDLNNWEGIQLIIHKARVNDKEFWKMFNLGLDSTDGFGFFDD